MQMFKMQSVCFDRSKSEIRALYVIIIVSPQLFDTYKIWKCSSVDFEREFISGESECGRNLTFSTDITKPYNHKDG